MIEKVREEFVSANDLMHLRSEFIGLKQAKGGNLGLYTVKFQSLANRLNECNDGQLFYFYLNGMKKASCEYVELIAPKTFAIAKERAVSKDNQFLRLPAQPSHIDIDQLNVKEVDGDYQPSLEQTIVALTAAVQELRPAESYGQVGGQVSDKERAFLMRNDGCFSCKKLRAGHRAFECPEKAKTDGRNSVANAESNAGINRMNMGRKLPNKPPISTSNQFQSLSESHACETRRGKFPVVRSNEMIYQQARGEKPLVATRNNEIR